MNQTELNEQAEQTSNTNESTESEINYVDYRHSYCHALEPKLKTLYYQAMILKKPVNYVIAIVLNAINYSADKVNWTEKEKQFINEIRACETSEQVYWRCANAVRYAKTHVRTRVNADGELVRQNSNRGADVSTAVSSADTAAE